MVLKVIISVLVALILTSCAVFSDGATVDYSRFLNVPLTIGFITGPAPYEADPGSKTHRSWQGNEPWSTWTHEPSNIEFRRYKNGPTIDCHTIQGFKHCR